jgi:hypothetical protein
MKKRPIARMIAGFKGSIWELCRRCHRSYGSHEKGIGLNVVFLDKHGKPTVHYRRCCPFCARESVPRS